MFSSATAKDCSVARLIITARYGFSASRPAPASCQICQVRISARRELLVSQDAVSKVRTLRMKRL